MHTILTAAKKNSEKFLKLNVFSQYSNVKYLSLNIQSWQFSISSKKHDYNLILRVDIQIILLQIITVAASKYSELLFIYITIWNQHENYEIINFMSRTLRM